MKVLVFAGQSNADGRGIYLQLDPVPSYAQTTADGWTGAPTASSDSGIVYEHPTAQNLPYPFCENNSGILADTPADFGPFVGCNSSDATFHPGQQSSYGPEVSFLWKYRQTFASDSVAVLKCVLGGSSILDWLPPNAQSVGGHSDGSAGVMWPQLSQMIQLAQTTYPGCTWGGLVWMQGESGASTVYPYLYPTKGQEYSDQLRFLLSAVRQLTSAAMPVAIGRISNSMLSDNIILPLVDGSTMNTATNLRGATNYRRSQQVLVGGDPNNCWWDNDNLPVLTSDPPASQYHFTGAGYLAMGERAWAAYAQLLGITPPPPPLATSYSASVTVSGSAASFVAGDGVSFVANADGSLRPVLTVGGKAQDQHTAWSITLNASQG